MKRISDEAFIAGYIPASGECVPKRQTFKQPEAMNMLQYLQALVKSEKAGETGTCTPWGLECNIRTREL